MTLNFNYNIKQGKESSEIFSCCIYGKTKYNNMEIASN